MGNGTEEYRPGVALYGVGVGSDVEIIYRDMGISQQEEFGGSREKVGYSSVNRHRAV